MGRKVPDQAKTAGVPQLRPSDTGGADCVVVTIASVELQKSQYRDYEQPVLVFEEFADKGLRLGKRGTSRMVEKFGDDMDDWVGETIPLLKGREEVGSNSYVVYQIPPVEEWAALLKANKSSRGSRR